jgi:hypothetical protein
MKKIFLISATFILSAITGFAQQVKPVAIDSVVTVSLPAAYQKTDTLGQQVFSSNSELGYVVVLRTPNAKNTEPLKRENDLDNVLKANVKSIQAESSNASAQFVRDTTIGKLKAKTFTLQTDNGQGDIQFRNIVLLYTTAATYVFEYVYPNARKDVIANDYSSFINSIKLSPQLQRNDQYLSNAKGMSPVLITGILILAVIGLVVFLIFYIQKRRRLAYE